MESKHSSKRHKLKSHKSSRMGHYGTLLLEGRCNMWHRLGVPLRRAPRQDSAAPLQLRRSLLHLLCSKPLVAAVRCHGLRREKHQRVQHRSRVTRPPAAHSAPVDPTDHRDTRQFGEKLLGRSIIFYVLIKPTNKWVMVTQGRSRTVCCPAEPLRPGRMSGCPDAAELTTHLLQ